MIDDILNRLPDRKGAVVLLSGGLDSTTSLRFAVEKYGADNVDAISFDYGQKQRIELTLAAETCRRLGVTHKIFRLDFLRDINIGFSANVDTDMDMPTIHDILGDPQPVTYVANRNMILVSIAASYAETRGRNVILAGFQANDSYGYFDTTPGYVNCLNQVLAQNREAQLVLVCPFVYLNKLEEIQAVIELDGNADLFATTLTCYNPTPEGESCGTCPSCSERLAAFEKAGIPDPIRYVNS